jgi:hypothetical protein
MTMLPPKPRRLSISAAAKPADTSSDNENSTDRVCRWDGQRFWSLALFFDEDSVVLLLDLPAFNRAQGWCTHRLAAAQIEAGVMPGTPNRFPRHDTVYERPMIVGAMGANREQLGPCADEQHLLIADVPHQPVIDESGQRDTLRKVRSAGRTLFLGHCRRL